MDLVPTLQQRRQDAEVCISEYQDQVTRKYLEGRLSRQKFKTGNFVFYMVLEPTVKVDGLYIDFRNHTGRRGTRRSLTQSNEFT